MVEPTEGKEETALTKEKTGKRKWLRRLGNFMVGGGLLLILLIVAGIWLLVSILT